MNKIPLKSVNRRILGAMVTVTPILLLGKVVSGSKDILVAARFGVGDEVDAFLVAFLLPSFIINLVSGSFNAALIPVYVHERESRGDKSAYEVLSSTTICTLASLALASGLLILAAPFALPLVASRFSASKLALASHLLLLLIPALVLNGLSTLWGAVLNAHDRFLVRALASLAIGIGPLICVAAFGLSWGISALALGTVAGFALEAAIVGAGVRALGVPLWPQWHRFDERLRRVLTQFAPMFMGSLVMGLNPIVDQSMAAALSPGSVAAIGYGGKAVAVILSLGAVAISTAVLPHFSTMVARNQWAGIRSTMRVYSGLVFGLSLAATGLGVFFSPQLVQLVFQHGRFTPQDARLVSSIQAFYLLQLPFHLTSLLFVRLISAMGRNQVLMWISVLNVITNTAGNYAFAHYLGVPGIALSTSLVFVLSSLASGTYVALQITRACHDIQNHVASGP